MKILKISEKSQDFFEQVFEVVKLIPEGRVTSYGAIANYLGAKGSSRMVGWAMNASHKKGSIPAHRVVNRAGVLTGKSNFPEENYMQKKLESEGIQVVSDSVVDFKSIYWDPNRELKL